VLGMRFGFTDKPVIAPVGAPQKRPGSLRCMKLDSPASAQRSWQWGRRHRKAKLIDAIPKSACGSRLYSGAPRH